MSNIIKNTFKRTGRAISNGMDIKLLSDLFGFLKSLFIDIFMPWKRTPPEAPESFEQVIKRMKLTEADIDNRKKMFVRQVMIYTTLGIAVFIYAIILASHGEIVGMFAALLVGILAFAYAFRSHFWYFQLKHRRLGCTFKEWLSSSVQG